MAGAVTGRRGLGVARRRGREALGLALFVDDTGRSDFIER